MERIPHVKGNKLILNNFDGFLLSRRFSAKSFQQAVSFEPRADDIIIAGYPKSGTTWMQYIVWDIINKGAPLPTVNEIWTKEVPHLELVGTDGLENLKSPRLLKVNLPFYLTPYHPSVKYICVFRNPWDCCISAYNHMKQVDDTFTQGKFEDYFEYFITGQVTHGDYFDHLLSWYTHWNDPNFLFLPYEEMKINIQNVVLKISRFLGEEYYGTLNENKEILENILRQIQFDYMKQNCPLTFSASTYSENNPERCINFFHSGKIGNWQDYFTKDQVEKLKEKCLEKLSSTEMFSMWLNTEVFDIVSVSTGVK